MEIVEIVGLKERLKLAVFVLLSASILVAVSLNDCAVTLTLAKQDKMFFAEGVERFTAAMCDKHARLSSLYL